MAKQPENSPEKSNFFLNVLNKYGRYLYLPGEPVPGQIVTDLYTISVMQQVNFDTKYGDGQGEAWCLRRITPTEPIDFLKYQKRDN